MRRPSLFCVCIIILTALDFAACKKSNSSTGGSNTGPDLSKYVVDTYSGSAVAHSINGPTNLCVDSKGFLYVAETNHNVILKVDPVAHLAGPFSGSFDQPGCLDDPFGNGDPSLTFPSNLWINDDIIYIGDYGCGAAKTCTTTGASTTIQYDNPNMISLDPNGACIDYKGNIYLFDTYNGLFEIKAADHTIVPIATGTQFGIISSMTMDASDKNVIISSGHKIREISEDGTVSLIAGSDTLGNADGNGANASFGGAMVICTGLDGTIYVADINNNLIRMVSPAGAVTTIAGDGKQGYKDGTGTNTEFYSPSGIAFTTIGDNNVLFVSDFTNNVIRRITFPKQ